MPWSVSAPISLKLKSEKAVPARLADSGPHVGGADALVRPAAPPSLFQGAASACMCSQFRWLRILTLVLPYPVQQYKKLIPFFLGAAVLAAADRQPLPVRLSGSRLLPPGGLGSTPRDS